MNKEILLGIDDLQPNLRLINLYQCAPGFNSGVRRLYDHYFLYVHKGKGIISVGDKKYNTTPGDLFFCQPGIQNAIAADIEDPFLLTGLDFDFTLNHRSKELLYPIHEEAFNQDYITESVSFKDFKGFPCRMIFNDDSQIRELIYTMIHQYNSQEKYWENYTNTLLHTFIIAVIRRITHESMGVKSNSNVDKVICHISENYMQDLTNNSLAQIFHYHPDYLSKIIHSYTGLTLKQYIVNLRIRAALNLLLNSDTPIKDIAFKVGYSNIHYFSHVFKMNTGFPPKYFRQHFETFSDFK